jgi:thymidylate synthase
LETGQALGHEGGEMGFVIEKSTVDDLMRAAITKILRTGEAMHPSRGSTRDIHGAVLTLTNPRARLSQSEGRGRLFSCLGELTWYLSKKNDVDSISYYIPAYAEYDENGLVQGGYGPRLFAFDEVDQVDYIIETLRKRPDSRRAVIQLFDHSDVTTKHLDVPCTCSLQFLVRGGQLQLIVFMRSNDAWLGLPHDIFCFTMLQELIANAVGVPVGSYIHIAGSLHLYEKDIPKARLFLKEGWQSTTHQMPEMPLGDQRAAADQMVAAEEAIRASSDLAKFNYGNLPYWSDLTKLLAIYTLIKRKDVDAVRGLQSAMSSTSYDVFIDERANRI